jgi:hypothetical protein
VKGNGSKNRKIQVKKKKKKKRRKVRDCIVKIRDLATTLSLSLSLFYSHSKISQSIVQVGIMSFFYFKQKWIFQHSNRMASGGVNKTPIQSMSVYCIVQKGDSCAFSLCIFSRENNTKSDSLF